MTNFGWRFRFHQPSLGQLNNLADPSETLRSPNNQELYSKTSWTARFSIHCFLIPQPDFAMPGYSTAVCPIKSTLQGLTNPLIWTALTVQPSLRD